MKDDAADVYYLRSITSETLQKKAIQQLREHDFKDFKVLVLRQLCKKLKLRQRVLERKQVNIYYKSEDGILCRYKYFLNPRYKSYADESVGCYGFWCSPPRSSSKREISSLEVERLRFDILPHIRAMRDFLTLKENACAEDIFKSEGIEEEEKRLRRLMQYSAPINFQEAGFSVYSCANMLKEYLNESSQPLFSPKYFTAYEKITKLIQLFDKLELARTRDHARRTFDGRLAAPDSKFKCLEKNILDSIQLIVHLMPSSTRELLKIIIDILKEVYTHREQNGMSAQKLGSIFAPLLVCPRPLPEEVKASVSHNMSPMIARIIKFGRDVFDSPTQLRYDVWEYTRNLRRELGLNRLFELRRSTIS